LQTKFLFDFLV